MEYYSYCCSLLDNIPQHYLRLQQGSKRLKGCVTGAEKNAQLLKTDFSTLPR